MIEISESDKKDPPDFKAKFWKRSNGTWDAVILCRTSDGYMEFYNCDQVLDTAFSNCFKDCAMHFLMHPEDRYQK